MRRSTKRRVTLSGDRAAEFFIGGLTGCLQIADQLKLRASVGAALMQAISLALPDLPVKGIVRAYHRLSNEVPVEIGAKMLAATALARLDGVFHVKHHVASGGKNARN